MPHLKPTYFTLVRDAAHYVGDTDYDAAVVPKVIRTTEELSQIAEAGGLIYNGSEMAEKAAAAANFPPETEGYFPQARGTFSPVALDGLHIYLPAKK